jgi:hypothetical protein
MLRDWSMESPDLWATDGFDGRWEIRKQAREGDHWSALPPNGCSYPYALVAPMMQATPLKSTQHAARDCMEFVYKTVGVKTLRERGPASTPPSIHRQFVVGSCGVTYVLTQKTDGSDWVAAWSGWDRHGEICDPDLPTLVGRLREVISTDADGYWPQGFRAEILAEDQRVALRSWTLDRYSQASTLKERLLGKGEQTPMEQALPGLSWAGRLEAYSESLSQQTDLEALLALQRSDDKTHYPGLSL